MCVDVFTSIEAESDNHWCSAQVALTALEFWQDMYVTTLQGLPSGARQQAMVHHTALLQQLTAALVLRAKLQTPVAASATADARDLPEEVRMVRMRFLYAVFASIDTILLAGSAGAF